MKAKPKEKAPSLVLPPSTPRRMPTPAEKIMTSYEQFIEEAEVLATDTGMPLGEWQVLLGEMAYDLTVRARQ